MRENEKQFKTAMLAYLSSGEVATGDLRAYARVIGVKSPTTKVNDVLKEEIVAILLGQLEAVPISSRGAPVKNKFVSPNVLNNINQLCEDYHIFDKYKKPQAIDDNILPTLFPRVQPSGTLVFEDTTVNDRTLAYDGQLVCINGVYYLFPLDCKNGNRMLVSEKTVEEHGLREGDIVTCRIMRGDKMLVATEILTVNGYLAKTFTRFNFDEELPCYPSETLSLGDVEEKTSLKFVDWVMPLKKGSRACIVSPPKAGKTKYLLDLALATKNNNDKTMVCVLLVDQSPEEVTQFRRYFGKENLVYTTYEDDVELQVFAADFLLKRAKRQVEHGMDVVLFVDSLSSLAKAFNDTEASVGGKTLAGGLESKTLQYVKRFFGGARKMENRGSLTIVGAISCDTGNPADELICGELCSISNFELHLDGALAAKRIYPAIDPILSKVGGEATEEEQILRSKYLPKYGKEAFLKALVDNSTQYGLYNDIQKSLEV